MKLLKLSLFILPQLMLSLNATATYQLSNYHTLLASAELAMSRADDINELTHMTSGPNPCNGICEPPPPLKSVTCTPKNSYLEKDTLEILNSSAFQELKSSVPVDLQLRTCIRESQNSFGGPFRTCDAQQKGLSQQKVPRACESDFNLDLISTSFAASVDCLNGFMRESAGDPAQKKNLTDEMYSLMSIESGFNVNAVSPTGASGMGQLTKGAVDHMNRLGIHQFFDSIGKSEKKSCQAISKLQPQMFKGTYSNRCEMVSVQNGNPLNNLLYTFFYQKIVRIQIEEGIGSLSDSNPGKSALEKAGKAFTDKLIDLCAMWGHNTGPAAIRNPLRNLLSSNQGAQLIAKKDINGIMKALVPLVASYETNRLQAKPERVKEASHYMNDIVARTGSINKNAGSSPGAPKCGI